MKNGLSTYISYRPEESWELAKLIHKAFLHEKFDIYLNENDRRSYDQNKFEIEKNKHLANADILLLLISRNTLNKCVNNEKDWMFQEIKYALDNGKIIIPIIDDTTYTIPDGLPKEFSRLNNFNAVFLNEKYFENCMANIFKFIIEEEYKALKNPERRDIKRIDNPKCFASSFQLKDEKCINEEVEKLNNCHESFDIDKKIYTDILSKYKKVNILQLGCGNGYFIKEIMSHVEQALKVENKELIFNYIGVDVNPNKIAVAKKYLEDDERYQFHILDLFSENFKKQLKELCVDDEGDPIKFDLIICRYLLNNFEDPSKIIEACKDLLNDKPEIEFDLYRDAIVTKIDKNILLDTNIETYKAKKAELEKQGKSRPPISPFGYTLKDGNMPIQAACDMLKRAKERCVKICGLVLNKAQSKPLGTLVVTELDDGFDLYNPDRTGLFAQFYNLLYRSPKSGNRYTGRGVYQWLYDARYNNINLKNLVYNENELDVDKPTPQLTSIENRINRFKEVFNELKNQYHDLLADKPYNKFYNQACCWLDMNEQKLLAEIKDRDFFYTSSYVIWTATK